MGDLLLESSRAADSMLLLLLVVVVLLLQSTGGADLCGSQQASVAVTICYISLEAAPEPCVP
jgi:hypothetical protein